jgi:hypothetical protein
MGPRPVLHTMNLATLVAYALISPMVVDRGRPV